MIADHMTGIERFEADLWKVADNLRANSNLARTEMLVALRAWFDRICEFELEGPDTVTLTGGQVRVPRSVPKLFGTARGGHKGTFYSDD